MDVSEAVPPTNAPPPAATFIPMDDGKYDPADQLAFAATGPISTAPPALLPLNALTERKRPSSVPALQNPALFVASMEAVLVAYNPTVKSSDEKLKSLKTPNETPAPPGMDNPNSPASNGANG